MRVAFHGATTMTSDLETDVRVTAGAGFKALELWATKVDKYLETHSVDELKALLANNNVAPMTFNSIEFIAFRGAEFEQIKARCRHLSALAQQIGCPSVAIIPSPTPKYDITWEAVVDEHVQAIRALSDIAYEYGVKLAFEFLGFGWCCVRTPRGAREIIEKVGRDNVGMVVDIAHFYIGGGLISEIEALDPKMIYAFHLDDVEDVSKEGYTDAGRVIPGLGVAPVQEVCAALKQIGYEGPCSIELFRPEYWGWDPQELAHQVRAASEKALRPHFDFV
jgi:2-keto-myo-inositol isomerase